MSTSTSSQKTSRQQKRDLSVTPKKHEVNKKECIEPANADSATSQCAEGDRIASDTQTVTTIPELFIYMHSQFTTLFANIDLLKKNFQQEIDKLNEQVGILTVENKMLKEKNKKGRLYKNILNVHIYRIITYFEDFPLKV